ncbi:unnamed protein product, partial [Anisakis simplex]|uniref:Transmembrane protein n=1 Tax=Anisakis simplex TaxID=6269 RepID=A0A0M3JHN5_ANISI
MDDFVKVEFFPKRLIALAGSLLPGLACYACIAYTYVFQSERARNFKSTDCENV